MKVIHQQQGFNLVEVLIALIVLSVGMLGIAGLYVQSLQAGRTSTFNQQAIVLASDVADRIRANPGGGAAYEGTGADNGCVGGTGVCDPAEMAANDILAWDLQAAATLPAGDVAIVHNGAVTPAEYTITVSWQEPGETPQYQITIPVADI